MKSLQSAAILAALLFSPVLAHTQDVTASTINYGNGAVVTESYGAGAPSGSCTGLAKYTQTDAPAGRSFWLCKNGTWEQQGISSHATPTQAGVVTQGTLAGNAPALDANGRYAFAQNQVVQPYGEQCFGDSTKFGWGATSFNYAECSLVYQDIGGPYSNYGVPGATTPEIAATVFQYYVRPPASSVNNSYRAPLISSQNGINDANLIASPTAAQIVDYNAAMDAFLTWLATPTENEYLAQSGNNSTTGTWGDRHRQRHYPGRRGKLSNLLDSKRSNIHLHDPQ